MYKVLCCLVYYYFLFIINLLYNIVAALARMKKTRDVMWKKTQIRFISEIIDNNFRQAPIIITSTDWIIYIYI